MNQQTAGIGVVPTDILLSYDGIDFLRAMIDGKIPRPPITETIGFRLIAADPGRAVFGGVPNFRHYNPNSTVHAGFTATLLDSAMACAVHTLLKKGEAYTTLELKLNLVRALTDDVGPVEAEGRIVHRGRSTATAEGHLRDGAGKLFAHATTTCMIFTAKA